MGNGNDILVGIDPVISSSKSYLFPNGLRSYLEDLDIKTLAQAHNSLPDAHHYWYSAKDLLLDGEWKDISNTFIRNMVLNGIHLSADSDSLLWEFNKKDGKISVAKAYECIVNSHNPVLSSRLYTSFWSRLLPRKIGCFLWLVLKNKVLTWDNIKKKGKIGPGICSLCYTNEETVHHLFSRCLIWKSILDLLCDQLQFYIPPEVDTIEEFMDHWASIFPRSSALFYLPHHTIWAIWKARDMVIFEGKKATVLGIYH